MTTLALFEHCPEQAAEDIRSRSARARGACLRMASIIRDLTDYTQLRIGDKLPVAAHDCDLDAICLQVLDEMQALFPGRLVVYRHRGDPHAQLDAARMAQVLSNLLANALKYSPDDARVDLDWWSDPAVPDELVLQVHNAGEPIPPALLPRIFEPYRRASTQGAHESLGLGLFIVKQIVEAHGGTVAARSDATHGTTFLLRLPRWSLSADQSMKGEDAIIT
jgi:signal transduction histidine kinase